MILIGKKFALFFLSVTVISLLCSCSGKKEKPAVGSEEYSEAVSDFYVALGAIQADQALFAVDKMKAVADRYPEEAAAWANLAVFNMRQGNFDGAGEKMQKALDLSDNDANILFLAGILESRRGNVDESIDYLRKAAEANPGNSKIAYALAEELERQNAEVHADEIAQIFQSIIEKNPNNLAVLLEIVRTSIKWNKQAALKKALDTLSEQAKNWPDEIQSQFRDTRETILSDSEENLTYQLAFLKNNLTQLPQFQSDLEAVQIPPSQVGFLITEFLWLPQPTTSVAPADTSLAFAPETITETAVEFYKTASLSDNQSADRIQIAEGAAFINNRQEIVFPGRVNSRFAVESLDYNYDFMNDLAFAGNTGFRLYRQNEDSTFTNVSDSTGLSFSVLNDSYVGVWSRDIDLDGDLDVILSKQEGAVQVLRNNSDGTFEPADHFSDITGIKDFKWADFDGDGDSDAFFLTKSGDLKLFLNDRSGTFTNAGLADLPTNIAAIDVADIDNDGNFELLAWNSSGVHQIFYDHETGKWDQKEIVSTPFDFEGDQEKAALYVVDLDNNGANDIVISTPEKAGYWLVNEHLEPQDTFYDLPANIQDITLLNDDTRLDIITLNENNHPQQAFNQGEKEYIARIIRPRASGPLGDQRINSFGIGGAIEIRSGLMYQKKLITDARVHFGLGTYDEAEMLRIIWPNGSSQSEFAELGYGNQIFNEQILKGSCPWVFSYNGEQMEFVTDFLWRTGLGIRINAQGNADVIHSIDWIKLDGNQLKPRNGRYDIRITADLWETHFFDYVSLKAVDHPENTEVFVDERFTLPPQQPKVHVLSEIQPVASAVDQDGNDVTAEIRKNDREYVDSFRLTKYQGITEDHYVELDLGLNFPVDEETRLVALGWVYPTDTSVNIAISQRSHPKPHSISLQVPDGNGGWKTVRRDIGFPAGKSKTMLIDLNGIFEPDTEHRIRLATNMEIYWNQLRWGMERTLANVKETDIKFSNSELQYRGFSKVKRAGRFIPERPVYEQISGTTPMWNDLEGFYTRFGDVNELVEKTDDRYVIMNAGDELRFSFPALDQPKKGMKRDFVLIGDGWVKDGDFNTGFSSTVIPLPYHGMKDYGEASTSLQADPVFKKHRDDWVSYHTRYISPKAFRSALKIGNK